MPCHAVPHAMPHGMALSLGFGFKAEPVKLKPQEAHDCPAHFCTARFFNEACQRLNTIYHAMDTGLVWHLQPTSSLADNTVPDLVLRIEATHQVVMFAEGKVRFHLLPSSALPRPATPDTPANASHALYAGVA
jgi:hypothetical protein